MKNIVYFGTYESDCPRNRMRIRDLGASSTVSICHAPLLENFRHKDASLLKVFSLVCLSVRGVVIYFFLCLKLLLFHRKADEIVTGYIGQIDTLIVWPFAKLIRCTLTFDPLVSLYDTLVNDRQMFREKSLVAKVLWKLDYLAFHAADKIIIDTALHKEYLMKEFSLASDKVGVIPVGAEDIFRPMDVPPSENSFTVLFYGKFIPLHGIENILQAMALIEKQGNTDIHLHLIGSGQCHRDMRALASKLNLKQIEWIDWVPYEELPVHINRADICLGIFGSSGKAQRVIPNKVWQCLSCGKEVITAHIRADSSDPLLKNIITVEANPAAIASAILRAYTACKSHKEAGIPSLLHAS